MAKIFFYLKIFTMTGLFVSAPLPACISDGFAMGPILQAQRIQGYEFKRIDPEHFWYMAGFRPGDLVLEAFDEAGKSLSIEKLGEFMFLTPAPHLVKIHFRRGKSVYLLAFTLTLRIRQEMNNTACAKIIDKGKFNKRDLTGYKLKKIA